MRKILLGFLFFFSISAISAQDPTPPEGLEGLPLRTWLMDNWYTPWHSTLGYTPARELMYGTIDANGGQIYCVYTGFHQASSVTSFPDPINTEHTVPQSWFNSMEPMKSDIHHIFPTHMDANTARGSLPFGEVPDNQTDDWFIGDGTGITVTSSIPSSNIDDYSEVAFNEHFEPKEASKGNTARAVFYFYTMYPNTGAGITDVADLNTLYQWHMQDPVDAQEIARDDMVQQYQGNYNPYIHSPELVSIAWGFPTGLSTSNIVEFSMYPIPAEDQVSITCADVIQNIQIIDALGSVHSASWSKASVDISALSPGIYSLMLTTVSGSSVKRFIKN